ncbi:acyl-coenzyme A:6-aminopenicillanic acid acyl-transferase-domain-containing protein [Microdochium bolleyi]|uniref:Acyl-coenzyme A:6-aminopenicillanic acid acyl-transferase-domain-containing protein n=1 Tax=Microdochium bolleyi TaxID=196109 RepID=A0A136IYL8_9PEZI|nr:acyl-coenzyme A:6-aminopenicillanic acid acyl-transferase-domain-containing protein [Microdochium bolleyi]
MVLQVHCSGSPYEIGYEHGRAAYRQVRGSLAFYADMFATKCALPWPAVQRLAAEEYLPHLEKSCPRYVEEMRGLSDGVNAAGGGGDSTATVIDLRDIVALNVRSEIVFGLFAEDSNVQDPPLDGCTSLGVQIDDDDDAPAHRRGSYLAQNWDWQVGQRDNLIVLHIGREITMVTEAGIIGKIGFNSSGVGVCQNAIRARGVDVASGRLPVHLAMRRVLESRTRAEAVEQLGWTGVAGSVYLLVGDGWGGRTAAAAGEDAVSGVECTSIGIKELKATPLDPNSPEGARLKLVAHTNHLLLEHAGVDEPPWLEDSKVRLLRIWKLASGRDTGDGLLRRAAADLEEPLLEMLKDEADYPVSINRHEVGESTFETLFSIVMNLVEKRAVVTFGRPSACAERIELTL